MRYQEILEACWTGYQQQGMKNKGGRQVPNCVPVEEVKSGPEITGKDLLFKAAAMAMLAASQEGQSLDYEQAIRQASKIYGIPYRPSELPRLLAQRQEIDRQLDLLKQGKQVAKQRRREKLAPTPADAEEYWKTHALPTDRIKPATKSLEETEVELAEDLKKWFKEKWVRFGPDGKIRGDCARGSSKEGKPKCLPQAKAQALGKKGRASSAAKKRREDPNPERRGPAKNVATKVKEDARSESEQQHGWRAELVDEISPITFEIRLTNQRSRESANFVVRPADLIRKGLAGKFSIDSMDIQDLQTGATRSIVTDDPAPWVYILDAVDALFHDTPALQARLEAQLKAHQDKNLPMLPGLKKREHAGQGIAVKDFVQGQQAAKDAIDRAQGKKDLDEKQDACYNKVKSRYKVWPSAYASGALVQCRKKGAANWGNKSKK
jgi:hypothetical protein